MKVPSSEYNSAGQFLTDRTDIKATRQYTHARARTRARNVFWYSSSWTSVTEQNVDIYDIYDAARRGSMHMWQKQT